MRELGKRGTSFNPKPEAMAGSGIDRPRVAPAIASGFGLNDEAFRRHENAPETTGLGARTVASVSHSLTKQQQEHGQRDDP